jgi:hypothetical protein
MASVVKQKLMGKKRWEKKLRFCSQDCSYLGQRKRIKTNCKQCGKDMDIWPCDLKTHINQFCSQSCSAKHRNAHKTWGSTRSKLEIYIEKCLTEIYPKLEIHYNKTSAIGSELDIYIPSLRLAFELNGIFHYEPIHGDKTLQRMQNNDQRKYHACIENSISLCIIDSSSLKYFKEERAKPFLKIITDLINGKLGSG